MSDSFRELQNKWTDQDADVVMKKMDVEFFNNELAAGFIHQLDGAGIEGHDSPPAFCGAKADCRAACGAEALCEGFDMHQTLPRCYLRKAACLGHAAAGTLCGYVLRGIRAASTWRRCRAGV